MNTLKTVARYRDAMSAHICAGMLNENGIPAAVFGENSSYISLNYIDELEVRTAFRPPFSARIPRTFPSTTLTSWK